MKASNETSLETRLSKLEDQLALAQSRVVALEKRAIKQGKEGHIKEIPVHLQAKKGEWLIMLKNFSSGRISHRQALQEGISRRLVLIVYLQH